MEHVNWLGRGTPGNNDGGEHGEKVDGRVDPGKSRALLTVHEKCTDDGWQCDVDW